MKRWASSIFFPALSLQVLSLPLSPPVWLQLDVWNFQLERAHFEVCSFFTSWFSWQQWGKDRILERCLEKVHFPPVWAGDTILAFLFLLLLFFFFFNLSSALFELSYFKALDIDLYVYIPFAFNLITVCYLWVMRGGNSLSCRSWWSAALGLTIVVDIVMSEDQFVTGESPQFTQSLTSYLHTSFMSKFLFY